MRCCLRPSGRSTFRLVLLWFFCGVAVAAISGCRSGQSTPASGEHASGLAGNVKQYPLKGVVVAANPATGEVSVDSQAIPGFMDAMIMPYKLAQPNIATELHPGDRITAVLLVSDSGSLLDQIVVTAQAKPDYKPDTFYNVPQPGQPVPDFKFLNQSGRTIHLRQFQGKVLLVTFIYTRCPLPDYCIRMSRNFAVIERALAADSRLYRETHLLTVSFDPGYDTPKVLRSYGGAYTGRYSRETFAHWDFAAPPPSELNAVDRFFDVGVTPGDKQTLTHSLSTVVIAPDGKIFRWYPSNDWSPSDLLNDVNHELAPRTHSAAGITGRI